MRKFIVPSEGRLRFGDVAMHKDLLRAGEECIGGGFYEFDYVGLRMLLSGRSYDFGRVKWDWVDTLLIPESVRGLQILYEGLPIENFAKTGYQ